ncbi:hypothetical protein [Oceanobacillus chungangensis]|uniref:Uncharacterized protein n=1 Tax=Oceanobacillus chungangensis TaxID=1229152 RepID=A0A3D8PIF7_9BACI|nr:hypothetical protein [Oceanobacillus chungangensis]RDW15883.1 hypothetical protein CWR45_16160 [Oceanobacillus chungangensis]
MKNKYLIIGVSVVFIILLSVFTVHTIQIINSNMVEEAAQDKIMQTEIIEKIHKQLDSYPISGIVLTHNSLEDIDINFSTELELKDDTKKRLNKLCIAL